mmetsp:Transcript_20306/g.41326  ORF Transcript_20306/g.41326 Transcript_20306/m.41326 type:complete len:300 (-) Transcript_20306:43-942(-)
MSTRCERIGISSFCTSSAVIMLFWSACSQKLGTPSLTTSHLCLKKGAFFFSYSSLSAASLSSNSLTRASVLSCSVSSFSTRVRTGGASSASVASRRCAALMLSRSIFFWSSGGSSPRPPRPDLPIFSVSISSTSSSSSSLSSIFWGAAGAAGPPDPAGGAPKLKVKLEGGGVGAADAAAKVNGDLPSPGGAKEKSLLLAGGAPAGAAEADADAPSIPVSDLYRSTSCSFVRRLTIVFTWPVSLLSARKASSPFSCRKVMIIFLETASPATSAAVHLAAGVMLTLRSRALGGERTRLVER